ncbi:MAG: ankyrin repeat domain-containing protein [Chloroflexi bacterium]|nr:ankyrin repeat domain-containing protein [Chloroflexota bacterium]MCL5275286.1 ankyrin repeat domain-containing protein [Chloroflexota bacterium]
MDAHGFIEAVKAGSVDAVKMALAADPRLAGARDESGLSVVLLAMYYGQTAIAQLLADRRTDLNIYEASAAGRSARVVELLRQEPSLANAFAADGFQPLGLAAFFGHLETVQALLNHGAAVNVASQNPLKVMPLHSAIANRHQAISRVLVEHGADVNARQQADFTPLMEAAQNGDLETAQLLLRHGADPQPTTTKGQTALSLAEQAGHAEMVELLRRALANGPTHGSAPT